MLMTAKSARKSPKTETTCAYQRRRSMGMRITSPIESGAGSSGSMGGFGIDSAGAGVGGGVVLRGEVMVPDRGADRGLVSRGGTRVRIKRSENYHEKNYHEIRKLSRRMSVVRP